MSLFRGDVQYSTIGAYFLRLFFGGSPLKSLSVFIFLRIEGVIPDKVFLSLKTNSMKSPTEHGASSALLVLSSR